MAACLAGEGNKKCCGSKQRQSKGHPYRRSEGQAVALLGGAAHTRGMMYTGGHDDTTSDQNQGKGQARGVLGEKWKVRPSGAHLHQIQSFYEVFFHPYMEALVL